MKKGNPRATAYEKQIKAWVDAIAKRQRDYVLSVPLAEIKTPNRKAKP